MKYKNVTACLAILISLCFSSGQVYGADDEILARVGNKNVTQQDLDMMINFFPEKQQAMIRANPENQDALLERLVTIMVVSDIAKKQKYDQKEDVKKLLDLLHNEYLTKTYLEEEILAKVKISDKETLEYYEKHKPEFERPEEVHARHILVAFPGNTDKDKKTAQDKAQGILERIKKGEDFAKLANESSDDPGSKENGGDLGFFPRNKMVPEFEEAAFALEPGVVSGLVETQYGYHIIKVDEKKKAEVRSFEEAKDNAATQAMEEARRDKVGRFIEQSFKEAHVKFIKQEAQEAAGKK
jgi:peptidyl-prolyl cis-trans isomerase C